MADLKKQYKKLKELAGNENSFSLSDEDALRYQDVLELLKERKYVMVLNADNENWYFKTAEWDGFEEHDEHDDSEDLGYSETEQ